MLMKTSRTSGDRSLLKFSLTLCFRYVKIPKIKDIVSPAHTMHMQTHMQSNTLYNLGKTDSNKPKNIFQYVR